MKSISSNLAAHLAQPVTTTCTLWLIVRKDGKQFGFTDFSQDIVYSGVTYYAETGQSPSSITTTSDLTVDNLEVTSVLNSSTITEQDMMAGLWDYAQVSISLANYADLTMGTMGLRNGWIGEVKTGRVAFNAEIRGMTQPLQQTIGRLFTPSCQANFGDSKCTINIASWTISGSVTGIIDQHSFIDTSVNQTNATVQDSITGITNANPAVVSYTGSLVSSGMQMNISQVNGMVQINGATLIASYIDANHFSLPIDTRLFGVYTGGGLATQEVPSEYFQGGLLTWTGGANAGLQMEVKSYYPNYFFLAQAMEYPIVVGDAYSVSAGCDKIVTTCVGRFNNVINFRGFPYIPGTDRMIAGT